jgi:ElaB/YqjD/DUF883 family membrane-anchored ribosome-binding protein
MVTEPHDKSKSTRTDPVGDEVDNLKDDLQQLKADVVHLFSHAFGLGKTGMDAMSDNAADAMEHLKKRIEKLRQRGADSVAAAGKKIEDNPIQSALIAFGVGFIVAKLLRRKG